MFKMIKNVGTIWEEKKLAEETERNKWRLGLRRFASTSSAWVIVWVIVEGFPRNNVINGWEIHNYCSSYLDVAPFLNHVRMVILTFLI